MKHFILGKYHDLPHGNVNPDALTFNVPATNGNQLPNGLPNGNGKH